MRVEEEWKILKHQSLGHQSTAEKQGPLRYLVNLRDPPRRARDITGRLDMPRTVAGVVTA